MPPIRPVTPAQRFTYIRNPYSPSPPGIYIHEPPIRNLIPYGQAFGPGFFVGSPYTRSPVGYYGVGPGLTNFDYWGVYTGRYNSPLTNPLLRNNFRR